MYLQSTEHHACKFIGPPTEPNLCGLSDKINNKFIADLSILLQIQRADILKNLVKC